MIVSTVATSGNSGTTERDDTTQRTSLKDAETRTQAAARAGAQLQAARLRCVVGVLYHNYGEMHAAIDAFTRALCTFESLGSVEGVAFCHSILGSCYFGNGEYKSSLSHEIKMHVLCGAYGRAVAEINIGLCYCALNELRNAHTAFSDALHDSRSACEPMLECIALRNLGFVSMRMSNMNEALTFLDQSLEVYSLLGNKKGASLCLLFLGKAHETLHNYEHSLFYYENAFQIAGEANNADIVSVSRVSIGTLKGQEKLHQTILNLASRLGCTHDATAVVRLLPS